MNKLNIFSLILTIIILIELIFPMSIATLYVISFCGWLSLLVRDIEDFIE